MPARQHGSSRYCLSATLGTCTPFHILGYIKEMMLVPLCVPRLRECVGVKPNLGVRLTGSC